MSLTDEQKKERVRAFFKEKLVPAAEKLRKRGIRFFPLGFEEQSTWYAKCASCVPELDELSGENVELRLRHLWETESLPELAELAGPLVQLAKDLEAKPDDKGEISEFIYEMF